MRKSDIDAYEMAYGVKDSITDIGIKRFTQIVILIFIIGFIYYAFAAHHTGIIAEDNAPYKKGTVVMYDRNREPKNGNIILYQENLSKETAKKHVGIVTSAHRTYYVVKTGKRYKRTRKDNIIGVAVWKSALIAPFASELITTFHTASGTN